MGAHDASRRHCLKRRALAGLCFFSAPRPVVEVAEGAFLCAKEDRGRDALLATHVHVVYASCLGATRRNPSITCANGAQCFPACPTAVLLASN